MTPPPSPKNDPPDQRPRPPGRGHFDRAASAAARVEDNACARALRAAGLPRGQVQREIDPSRAAQARLTFADLARPFDFPARPSVSGERPDNPARLFKAFARSTLWAEWVSAWDARPGVPAADRVLVMADPGGWDTVVVRDATHHPNALPPAFVVGPPGQPTLVVTYFNQWLVEVRWAASADTAGDD